MPGSLVGSIIIGVPALLLAWALLWRRHTPVFWFAAALILVGLGYLATIGAADDIARTLLPALVEQRSAASR